MRRTLAMAAMATVALVAPAHAGEAFGGLYVHDIDDTISHGHYEESPQVVVGVRTTALDELAFLGRARVHLLAGVNPSGGTDYLAAGFSWRLDLSPRWYVQPGIGVAVHDGHVGLPSPDETGISAAERARRLRLRETRLDLGSRVLFEPELSLGWKATDRLSLELSWIHLSHAKLAGGQNPGLGDLGLRFVYRYGLDR